MGAMNIGLIGFGKMGKEVMDVAVERGHTISLVIDIDNEKDLTTSNLRKCDVAIEFSSPSSAVPHYLACFEAGVPVVSGTTGWLDKQSFVFEKCREKQGTFFYASNFSIGVNLFFELNRKLAEMMNRFPGYSVGIREIHHMQKVDSPSGTAISLANDLMRIVPGKTGWRNDSMESDSQINIVSERTGSVPGIHAVTWESDADFINITHEAKSRKGFALGAVLAAEFCPGHQGILGMRDMIDI